MSAVRKLVPTGKLLTTIIVGATPAILRAMAPILYVRHEIDGAWYCSHEHVVHRDHYDSDAPWWALVERDPTLEEIARMPCGSVAIREAIKEPWQILNAAEPLIQRLSSVKIHQVR